MRGHAIDVTPSLSTEQGRKVPAGALLTLPVTDTACQKLETSLASQSLDSEPENPNPVAADAFFRSTQLSLLIKLAGPFATGLIQFMLFINMLEAATRELIQPIARCEPSIKPS
ncbi:hypothetical protein E4U40_002530 [Claviceps sp. LM458 group G5]|nr:hypothetical protein E4U40_002530 [Claviceps sp. LM458 group G5]